MERTKRRLAILGGVAALGVLAGQGVAAAWGTHQGTDLRFGTMAPVTGPYVGTANPIRGVPGGGLPWMLRSAHGSLARDGHLHVTVRGLVLADKAPVPPALRGTNPVPDFRAIVSCQTIGAGGTATVTNVSTAQFPADTRGDSTINARLDVPEPCVAPVVFVTSPTGAWFAATGG